MKKLFFLIIAAFSLFSTVGLAQGWNIDLLEIRYDDWLDAENIAVSGDYACVALNDQGIAVVDISDPQNPIEVALAERGGDPKVIQISGDYAYIGYTGEGIKVLNIMNPLIPYFENVIYPVTLYVSDLFIDNDLMYITHFDCQLTIIDISDPLNPGVVSVSNLNDDSNHVFVSEDKAYIANDRGFIILDVADPFNPFYVNGIFDLPGNDHDLSVSGNLAFISRGIAGMYIYDVSDPAMLIFQANVLFNNNAVDAFCQNNFAFVSSGGSGLYCYDISNPALPHLLSQCDPPGANMDMVIAGDFIFSAYDSYGMRIIDVSDPANTYMYKRYDPSWKITNVTALGNYAIISADDNGLIVIDTSDPFSPFHAAHLSSIGEVGKLNIYQDIAYTMKFYVSGSLLNIIDISDPLNLEVLAEDSTVGYIQHIDNEQNLGYAVFENYYLQIVDVSDPVSPQQISLFNMQDYRHWGSIAINEGYLYGITTEYSESMDYCGDSLIVVNVNDPANPVFVDYFDSPYYSGCLRVQNDFLYLSASDGLYVYDLSNPEDPQPVGFCQLPGSSWSFEIVWDYAYIAAGPSGGLRVVDITDPYDPRLSGCYVTPGHCNDIAVHGEVVYVADWDHFEIYDCDEAVGVNSPSSPGIANTFVLSNPYPIPFNAETVITFTLPKSGEVSLKIYDIQGRIVQTLSAGQFNQGWHRVTFNAENLASGVYFINLTAGDFTDTKKTLLLK